MAAKVDMRFAWSVVPASNRRAICGTIHSFIPKLCIVRSIRKRNKLFHQIDSFGSFHSETECGKFRSWTCFQCAAIFASENVLSEHMGSHGIKHEFDYDDIKRDIRPLMFIPIDCVPNLNEGKVKEQSMDDSSKGSEFYGTMDFDGNQNSDNFHGPPETLNVVKEEADDNLFVG